MVMQSTNSLELEEKLPRATKPKRNRAAIHRAMMQAAGGGYDDAPTRSKSKDTGTPKTHGAGLTQRELEDCRWNVSPAVAKEKLLHVGLPYHGRREGLIYSWASIFRAEGMSSAIVEAVTPEDCPELYDNLLNTAAAAKLLGYQDPSSIRKLVGSGDVPETAYITFGARGVYRFRPAPLMALRKTSFVGRIV